MFRVLYNSSRTPNFSDQILFASKIQGIGMSPYLAWYSGYIVGTDSHEQRLQKAFLILFHASITVFRVVCMNCDPDFFHLEGKQKAVREIGKSKYRGKITVKRNEKDICFELSRSS